MQAVKDIHSTISTVLGATVGAVLLSIADTKWWSCADDAAQIATTWEYGVCGLLGGLALTLVLRHYGHGPKLMYYTEVAVRLLLLYTLTEVALIKTEGQFYDLTLMTQENKLSDLDSSTFASAFYGYSPQFQSYSGAILLGGLALIVFRRTQRLGYLILAATLINSVVLNHSFESCYLFKNGIYLSAIAYLVYNDLFGIYAFTARTTPLVEYRYTPLKAGSHLSKSLAMYKVILLGAFMMYNHDSVLHIKNYKHKNAENPIAGVWKVERIDYLAGDMPDQMKEELENFESFIIDKGRFGAVTVADSMSYFEFVVDPDYHQLEFWNFFDYRQLDLKGRYEQVGPDTLLYIGRNNKDSLQIVFTKDKNNLNDK